MGSPTELVTEQLYELNAYGSAMAPLFMNLTFWIGAFNAAGHHEAGSGR